MKLECPKAMCGREKKGHQKKKKKTYGARRYLDPAKHNYVRASILCIHGSLKQAHRPRRVLTHWRPNIFLTPPSNPRFFPASKSMRSLKSRQSPWSVRPFPFFSGRGSGFNRCLAAADIITEEAFRVSHIMLEFFGFNAFIMSRKNHV